MTSRVRTKRQSAIYVCVCACGVWAVDMAWRGALVVGLGAAAGHLCSQVGVVDITTKRVIYIFMDHACSRI